MIGWLCLAKLDLLDCMLDILPVTIINHCTKKVSSLHSLGMHSMYCLLDYHHYSCKKNIQVCPRLCQRKYLILIRPPAEEERRVAFISVVTLARKVARLLREYFIPGKGIFHHWHQKWPDS